MTTTLKSYGLSLILHATLFAALYSIPASTVERFASPGRQQVLTFQQSRSASLSAAFAVDPPAIDPTRLEANPAPAAAPAAAPVARQQQAGIARRATTGVRLELPRVAEQPIESDIRVQKLRRNSEQVQPPVHATTPPPPLRAARSATDHSAAAAIPIEQFVGLEENTPVDLSHNPPPAYPPIAIQRRLEGVVLLRIQISHSGRVQQVKLIKSSGHAVLDQAAIDAVGRWHGKPAKRWGRAIESVERLPIRFRL